MPITDERINEIILALEEAKAVTNIDPEMVDDEIELIYERLSLRSQKARLIERITKVRDNEQYVLATCPSLYGSGAKFAYDAVLELMKILEE